MDNHTTDNQLARPFNLKTMARFSLPTMAMMVMLSLYTIVDGLFVSNFVGTDALSSINILMLVIALINGVGIMFASGGSAIVARKQGQGMNQRANELFTSIILTAMGLGCIFLIVGCSLNTQICQLLGATDRLLPYCTDYALFLYLFAPITIFKSLSDTFLITAGKPHMALVASIAGGVTNVLLDYLFIGVLGTGVMGAAIATGLGQVVSGGIALIVFLNHKNVLHLTKPVFRIRSLLETVTNGSSELVTSLASGITSLLFNYSMLRYVGEDGVAAMTIANYSIFLILPMFMGMFMGVAPLVSYNYGKGDKKQLHKIFRTCCVILAIFSGIFFALLELIAPLMIQMFANGNEAVAQLARHGMVIFSFCMLFLGLNIFSSSFFTSLSNGLLSAVLSFSKNLIFVVAGIFLLPLMFDLNGIWLTIPVSEFFGAILSVTFLLIYRKKYGYGGKYVETPPVLDSASEM